MRVVSFCRAFPGLPPCGGSGLKCDRRIDACVRPVSPSVWREWIEISRTAGRLENHYVSLRVEGVD